MQEFGKRLFKYYKSYMQYVRSYISKEIHEYSYTNILERHAAE